MKIIEFVLPLALIFCSFVLGFFIEKRALKRLKQIAKRRGWSGYEILLNSLQGIPLLWFVIVGTFFATLSLPTNTPLIDLVQKILLATFLASATFVISRLSVGFIKFYSSRSEEGSPFTSLLENLTRLLIISLGILIILQSLGIAITPLLTALGIGGVSIGLALQNTLANLFSGINIITSRKVRPGDYIKLMTGEEGYVTDIAWRYTVIREYTDNLVVVPNSKLIASSFTNYALPTKELLMQIEISVSYDSDLEKVEVVTLEVAKEVLNKVEGGVSESEPFIRYNKFDYFSIRLTIYLRIREFIDHLIIRHEFMKRLHKRYKLVGIEIPFPIKTSYIPEPKSYLSDLPKQ
ncbi:MAG: mechanosensitive ion channel family protein [Coleofasciculaceae cyanobacterium]